MTRASRSPLPLALVAALALLPLNQAIPSSSHPRSFCDLVAESELVFEGEVLAIDSRESDVESSEDIALPHTFVTLRLDHVLVGTQAAGSTITLRFIGGPTSDGKRILRVSGIPQFRIGERNLLFVRDNGATMCPLVGWEDGRSRVVGNALSDEFGRDVWLTATGDLWRAHDANRHAPREDDDEANHARPEPPPAAVRLDADNFRTFVQLARELLVAQHAPVTTSTSRSVAIGEPFRIPAPRPVPAPAFDAARGTETSTASADGDDVEPPDATSDH